MFIECPEKALLKKIPHKQFFKTPIQASNMYCYSQLRKKDTNSKELDE